jgi:hypothetical protein
MKRLAIFVEGATQQIFARRALEEIAGRDGIVFEHSSVRGSKIGVLLEEAHLDNAQRFVLIYDCGGDGSVKSAILERLGSLQAAGYEMVLGLVDVYPRRIAALAALEKLEHTSGLTVEVIGQGNGDGSMVYC